MDLRNYGVIDFAEHVDLDRLNAFHDLGHMAHVDAFWNHESKKNKDLLKKNLDLTYKVNQLEEQKEKLQADLQKTNENSTQQILELQKNLQTNKKMTKTLKKICEDAFKNIDKLKVFKEIYMNQQKHLAKTIDKAYASIKLNGAKAENAIIIQVIEELQKLDVASTEQKESDENASEESKAKSKSEEPKAESKQNKSVRITGNRRKLA